MKILVVLCFVAAVAQAVDVDWNSVYPLDVYPEYMTVLQSRKIDALESRIVGGQEASPGQFPYQIGLLATTSAGTGFCGGSILNEQWILTAAHCVDGVTATEVVFAAHNIQDSSEKGQLSIKGEKIVIHENWDSRTIKNDIALIKLGRKIRFSDRVQPTRLPSRSQVGTTFASVTGTVSGWGKDSDSSNSISPVLRWVSNPILRNLACSLYYFGSIGNDQICLSGSGGRSSCNGDSGGPLVVTDSDGEVTQVGIVSFGIALGCSVGWPGVYVRVTDYLDWIATNTDGTVTIRD